jgi:GNAT superfamily N-acetyltransferase
MTISYQQERFEEIWPEIEPLLLAHYHEIAMYQDKIDLNPDRAFYEYAQDAGRAYLHTVRCKDKGLIGYAATFVNHNPHYMDHVYAVNDVIFIDPEYRGTDVSKTLMTLLEADMRTLGVSVMTFHMKEYKPFRSLMSSCGFELKEELWAKYIGE